MAEKNARQRPHFQFTNDGKSEPFLRPSRGYDRVPFEQKLDRRLHGGILLEQIKRTWTYMDRVVAEQRVAGKTAGLGLQVEFQSQPGIQLLFESLGRERQGIELLNVRRRSEDGTTLATVFVPDGQLKAFEKLVTSYATEGTDDKPRNAALVNTIQEIRVATFHALWTDAMEVLPKDSKEKIWWEFWLPVREDAAAVLQRFQTYANALGFDISKQALFFPERTVLNLYGSQEDITASLFLLNEVAEIRRTKETADFFDSLDPEEQREWATDLLQRMTPKDGDSVRICLIDTGVSQGHPLLKPHIDLNDLHAIDPQWSKADECGHGTGLAGIALYGDLCVPLESQGPVTVSHRLESVKILRKAQGNQDEVFGALTMNAVARPEISHPERKRVFSMAVTSIDDRDRGRPSAWSATLDSLTIDALGGRKNPRLFIVSAGNANEEHWDKYPDSNIVDGIHDPGQAWNALCVGAYTLKDKVKDYQAVAAVGGLSPFSTTSVTWNSKLWPIKPDVVFEGGNLARNAQWTCTHHDLMLLTTSHMPQQRTFSTTWATSAASALAARLAAQIIDAYPHLRPETVRALIVHSAEWTDRMKEDFLAGNKKGNYGHLVRVCGFGVPSLERALWSVSNSLTMVIEDEFQPFQRKEGSSTATNKDMHLHLLPWPREELLKLGNEPVEMRVTLSYYIEPNPGVIEIGAKGRYRYESHGLRFEVSRAGEDVDLFRYRVNEKAREEDEEGLFQGGGTDPGWKLGYNARHHGSLHSDIWEGEAVNLADLGMIAITPAPGWWKTNPKKKRFAEKAKYSLVVSIKTQQTNVDLYATIEQVIAAKAVIET